MASPSVRQLCLAIACLVGLIGASLYFHTSTCSKNPAAFTDHVVTINLDGLKPNELEQVTLDWTGSEQPASAVLVHRLPEANSFTGLVPPNGKLRVTLPNSLRSKLNSIKVTERGKRAMHLDLTKPTDHVLETHTGRLTQLCQNETIYTTSAAVANQLWLWFSLALLLAAAALLLRQGKLRRLAAGTLLTEASRLPSHRTGWFTLGFSITAAAIATLEIKQPLFFLQDDNYIQFLPVILQGCKSAFNGDFPLYNPLQLLGAPTASIGTYALTYPGIYIAYFCACLIKAPEATLDAFAILHLLSAYAVMYLLLIDSRVRGSLSACGAFSYALSGFFLIAGRSWYYMLPVAVWAPLMVLITNRLLRKPCGLSWLIIATLAVGIFFHSGNAQMWFYTIMFCAITSIAGCGLKLIGVKRLIAALPAVIAGIGIAFPLLYLQFVETESVWRHHDPGDISGVSLLHMLLPLGEVFAHEETFAPGRTFPAEMCHFGIIFGAPVLMTLFLLIARISFFKTDKALLQQVFKRNIWLIAFLIALLLAWGSQGVLWDAVSWLPVLNKFTQSGKLLAFVTIFGVIVSAVLLERLFLLTRINKRTERFVFVAAILALFVHLNNCQHSFYDFADAPAYPALPTRLRESCVIKNDINEVGRILAISPERSREMGFTNSLAQNFPTYYNVISLSGMDLLVSTNALTLGVFKRLYQDAPDVASNYGVRWIVVHDGMVRPSYGNTPWLWRYEQADFFQTRIANTLLSKCVKVAELEHVTLYENPDAKPLVFTAERPESSLPTKVSTRGLTVDVNTVQSGETVIAAFIARPWLVARLDGKPIPIIADAYERVSIKLPGRGAELRVEYEPPLFPALAGGFALLLIGWALAFCTRKWANGDAQISQANKLDAPA